MRKILLLVIFLLSPVIANASCLIQSHFVTGTLADGSYTIVFSDQDFPPVTIPFSVLVNGTNQDKADDLRKRAQVYFEEKFLIGSLPLLDPSRNLIVQDSQEFYATIDGQKESDLQTVLAPEDKYYYSRGCEVTVDVIGKGKNATVEVTLTSTT